MQESKEAVAKHPVVWEHRGANMDLTMHSRIRLYHITHADNLVPIVRDDGLLSDKKMIARGGTTASIGMGSIKERRLAS